MALKRTGGLKRGAPLKRGEGLKRGTSELARGTGLKRGDSELARGKGPAPMSDKRKAASADRAKVRAAVFARDGQRCQVKARGLVPDVPCFGPLTAHHLRKASAGGAYSEDNLLSLCARHNDWIENEPDRARALGLVR